jgi:hypothetical protein
MTGPELSVLLLGALGGVFSGCGGTLLWEMWLRPRRARRSLARALAAETGQNLQLIYLQSVARERNPLSIPLDFRLGRAMFDAQAANIGEMPPTARGSAVRMYNLVDYLNEGVRHYSTLLAERDRLEPGAPGFARADRAVASALDAWNRLLDQAFDQANVLNSALFDWAEKGIGAEKFVTGDADELRRRGERGLEERERQITAIQALRRSTD